MAQPAYEMDGSMASERFGPFSVHGDAFLVVSPWGLYLANASPTLIHQIALRRTDWIKPVEHYAVVEPFGPNVLTTEGSTWRDHRKVTSGAFNERSNAVVWKESVKQAEEMIKAWGRRNDGDGKGGMWVKDVYPDAATASLHIISRSGFGVRLLWEGEEMGAGETVEKGYERFTSHTPTGEHTMAFKESMRTMLRGFIWMGVFSKATLKRLPFKQTRKVYEGYTNLNDYLHELLQLKKTAISNGLAEKDTFDLMVPLITSPAPTLPTPSILGNAFVFLFAGHETTANSITFLLILLALNPSAQRRLQSTLSSLLPSRSTPPSQWPYPSLFNTLGSSYLGACINEQLRLIPSVPMMPKRSSGPHTLVLDTGAPVTLPGGTFQHFCAPSVHCSPKYWPHQPRSLRDPSAANDLMDFVPERWLLDEHKQPSHQPSGGHAETVGELENSAMDIGADKLFNPARGAFIPFSDGPRGCLGRRFAMVELVAVMATIFRSYSVELDVRAFIQDGKVGSSEELERRVRAMGPEEKAEVYARAGKRAWRILDGGLGGLVTLQQQGEKIPVRVCERGGEMFW
ncbi:MAG: hypothetical protein Q9208_001344 [Pyrenodesmia sp. 3 TL-2023]